jgi:hypothetical protein
MEVDGWEAVTSCTEGSDMKDLSGPDGGIRHSYILCNR